MNRIIGITGYAQSGKNTAADHLSKAHGFRQAAFADGLRELMDEVDPVLEIQDGAPTTEFRPIFWSRAISYYGYNWTKANTNARDVMVRLGAGARRIIGPHVWVDAVRTKIENEPDVDWAITDVRYASEVDMILELGGEVWRIDRPGVDAANEEEYTSAIHVFADRNIQNNGTVDDLHFDLDLTLNLYDARRGGVQLEFEVPYIDWGQA